ncbi:MAG: methyltransferase [Phreatobacter sp.]|uniref:SAM-dependent methyltransferase n=1 Tax=Phreatobacter sp. TaxID=1966341 RepID=UPI001A40D141|nr:class I SAM-dependent methyltransferase [Phreatobacter sp.]MBL8569780.1 methyltransferase [Phreatobacter sp.]
MLKNALSSPVVYQKFQEIGGFFGARVKAMAEFLTLEPGMRILDIGCGPGNILDHLPKGIHYFGFDVDDRYIRHAQRSFAGRGTFFCRHFDARTVDLVQPVDVALMNGVLHHVTDEELRPLLDAIRASLRPGGLLFTLDGCYVPNQHWFNRWMLDNDRGRFVRDEAGYRRVLQRSFGDVAVHVRETYSRVPYTFAVGISRTAGGAGRLRDVPVA